MFDFKNAKEDKRPKKNGFAPGHYTCTCSCGVGFIGDKRSSECADCAYDEDRKDDYRLVDKNNTVAVIENITQNKVLCVNGWHYKRLIVRLCNLHKYIKQT